MRETQRRNIEDLSFYKPSKLRVFSNGVENRTLFGFVLAFAVGILIGAVFDANIFFGIFLSINALALFFYERVALRRSSRSLVLFSIILFSIGFGISRYDFAKSPPVSILESHVSQTGEITGTIIDEPDRRPNNTQVVLQLNSINFLKKEHPPRGITKFPEGQKVLLFLSRYADVHYGDSLHVTGELEKPKNFEGNNGREFNYVSYLGKDGISYIMFYPEFSVVSSGNGNVIKAKLFALKEGFLTNITKLIPEPEAGLLGGLVVGQKHGLGNELLNDFRKVGVIHVVVLSGYNVSLVAEFIMRLFSFLPAIGASLLGGTGIVLFVILSGGSTTAVRAGAMAVLVIIARATGRTADALRLLFLVGFGMLLWNPKVLLSDPSFQLSFMATFGLLFFSPVVAAKLSFLPQKHQVREIVSATIATQIFVLPIILFMMGNFSIISVPINLAVLLFVPVTMLIGFVAGIIGFFSIGLALPFAYLAYLLLSYEIGAVSFAANVPFASFVIPHFPIWILVVTYIAYGLLFFWYWKFGKNVFLSFKLRRQERALLPEWELVEIGEQKK